MKTSETLTNWKTPLEFCNRIRMKQLLDNGELYIRFIDVSSGGKEFEYEFHFENFSAYRSTDESYLNGLWSLRTEGIGYTFVINNSKWVKELMIDPVFQDNCGGIIHYVVATLDEGVEVLSKKPPIITPPHSGQVAGIN